jgi:hypothetical protein
MATQFTAYNEYMAAFDAEQRARARSAAFLTASVAKYLPTLAPPTFAPKAVAPAADFTDEHTCDEAWRAEMRAAQRAEWNENTDWRTR